MESIKVSTRPAERETAENPQRALWRLGDYATVARDVLPDLGTALVAACGIRAGMRVLDVAAGSGNAALPAAEAGAHVVALDLTPELFEAGRAEAVRRGVEVEWIEGDAQAMPFEDGDFDVVMSCIGAMFAPDHEATARELVRVCRPGGTLGMINWPPEGSVAGFFKTFSAYAPLPPEDFRPPTLWGSEEYLKQLFGADLQSWDATHAHLVVDHFATPQEFCDYYRTNFGPTIATYAGIVDDPDRVASLDRDFLAFATEWNVSTQPGRAIYHLEYLLTTARRADA